MECMQEDLKACSGLASAALKTMSNRSFMEDCKVVCGGQAPDTGEDLFADDFLDFSDGFFEAEEEVEVAEEKVGIREESFCFDFQCKKVEHEDGGAASAFPAVTSSVVGKHVSTVFPCCEIDFQVEGLESLEWLSNFVEESYSDYPLTGKPHSKPEETSLFTSPVQTKARTKRARTGIRVWPVSSRSLTESSSSSSSSISSVTPPSRALAHPVPTGEFPFKKPPVKRQKVNSAGGRPCSTEDVGQQRRCSHCYAVKTPQWRAGPAGPKTLCNACGVRFKTGRLFPEYRPACSPTFSNELHSNSHRKVLEMRRWKEEDEQPVCLNRH